MVPPPGPRQRPVKLRPSRAGAALYSRPAGKQPGALLHVQLPKDAAQTCCCLSDGNGLHNLHASCASVTADFERCVCREAGADTQASLAIVSSWVGKPWGWQRKEDFHPVLLDTLAKALQFESMMHGGFGQGCSRGVDWCSWLMAPVRPVAREPTDAAGDSCASAVKSSTQGRPYHGLQLLHLLQSAPCDLWHDESAMGDQKPQGSVFPGCWEMMPGAWEIGTAA